jgi:molybdopterin converting factor small subunit
MQIAVIASQGKDAMKVTIKLFAGFRENRFKVEEREIPQDCTIAGVLDELGIEGPELGVALINGRHVEPDQTLRDGETVSLFPKVGGG